MALKMNMPDECEGSRRLLAVAVTKEEGAYESTEYLLGIIGNQ